jgi:putative transposase
MYKKVTGRKRSILVDALGFLICCFVHKGNDQDFRGLMALLHRLPAKSNESLQKILGDQAYRFSTLKEEAASRGIEVETLDVKKLGTNLKPKRWIVERTIAWFNHFRRLSRDYEKNCASSEAILFISQTQILLRRYAHGSYRFFLILSKHPPAEAYGVKHCSCDCPKAP